MSAFHLLILDDEALIRQGLMARIRRMGLSEFELLEADSAAAALALFQEMPIHAVLADICMPDQSGLQFIAAARKLQPETLFVVLSGFSEFAYAQEAISLGVRAYLCKPVSNAVLRQTLADLLHQLSGRDPEQRQDEAVAAELGRYFAQSGRGADGALPALSSRCPALLDRRHSVILGVLQIERSGFGGGQGGNASSVARLCRDEMQGRNGWVFACPQQQNRLYLPFFAAQPAALSPEISSFFEGLLRRCRQAGIEDMLFLGCSRPAPRLHSLMAEEASAALLQRRFRGQSALCFYEAAVHSRPQGLPNLELEILRREILRGSRSKIQQRLEELFSEDLFAGGELAYLNWLWVSVISLMLNTFPRLDRGTVNHLLIQVSRFEAYAARDQIIAALMNLADQGLSPATAMEAEDKVDSLVRYIQAHYNEEISIQSLADHYGMTPGYLSSLFKKKTKKTIVQYITDLRMKRAREYLEKSSLSMADIAQNVGFNEAQYFSRVFKKSVGITPGQYRLVHRKKGSMT